MRRPQQRSSPGDCASEASVACHAGHGHGHAATLPASPLESLKCYRCWARGGATRKSHSTSWCPKRPSITTSPRYCANSTLEPAVRPLQQQHDLDSARPAQSHHANPDSTARQTTSRPRTRLSAGCCFAKAERQPNPPRPTRLLPRERDKPGGFERVPERGDVSSVSRLTTRLGDPSPGRLRGSLRAPLVRGRLDTVAGVLAIRPTGRRLARQATPCQPSLPGA